MRRRTITYLLLGMATLALPARSQAPQRPREIPAARADSLAFRNAAGVLFTRNLDTYNWNSRIFVDTSAAGVLLSLRHLYIANIIQTNAPKPASYQQNLSASVAVPISSALKAATEWSSLLYTDNRSAGLNRASFVDGLAGLQWFPVPAISLTPMAGYRWDTQAGIRDDGPSLLLRGQTHAFELGGYWLTGAGQFRADFLDPRKLEDHFLDIGAQKLFAENAADSLRLGVSRNRRDFYGIADGTIESRIDNSKSVSNLLHYDFLPSLGSNIFVGISARNIDRRVRPQPGVTLQAQYFDTRIDQLWLDLYVETLYRSADARTQAGIRVSFNERTEGHHVILPESASPAAIALYNERARQEQTKDNSARRTAVAGMVAIPLTSTDQVSVSGTASILRYDTPSLLNVEERDEQLVTLTVTTVHQITRSFRLELALDGHMSHLVYLLKERSANNNINRVLRFAPLTEFHPAPFFRTVNLFEVLANYTVYDFEDQTALAKSFSYRQFAILDSTALEFSRRLGLDFFAYFKLYERGQLNWDAFTERTENRFADQTYDVQLRFKPAPSLLLAAGLRYFSQTRYTFDEGERVLASFIRSIGPTTRILWSAGRYGRLQLSGWFERKLQPGGVRSTYPNLALNILLNF